MFGHKKSRNELAPSYGIRPICLPPFVGLCRLATGGAVAVWPLVVFLRATINWLANFASLHGQAADQWIRTYWSQVDFLTAGPLLTYK